MTAVASPPDSPAPAIGAAAPEQAATRARRVSPAMQMITTAVLILSATLLGFALYVGVLSTLYHDRAQHNAYANFRKELALATAPTGPMQPDHPDRLLPLGAPVAVLHIPKLNLREVVFEGTTPSVLQDGPGHLRSTVLPGQAGISEIMGRAATYGGPFGRISQLQAGDTITITTGQAANTYRVLDVRRAGDPVPKPLAPGGGRLLLATAQGAAFIPSGVLRVDADLSSAVQPTATPGVSSSQLPHDEQAMATDPTAWMPLVLWGQGLVLAALAIAWARSRWGRWQIWIVAVPVLGFFGLEVADQAARLLPNLM